MERWTLDSLHEHVVALLVAERARVDGLFAASKEAILAAKAASDHRMDELNHVRRDIEKSNNTFYTKVEAEAMGREISQLRELFAAGRGRKLGASELWAIIATAIALLLGLATIFR